MQQQIKKGEFDKGATARNIWNAFNEQSNVATERARLMNKAEISTDDMVSEKDGVKNESFKNLLYADNGLISYFDKNHDDWGIRDGKDVSLGERGFFYHMASGWYNEMGHNLHPNTSDIDWRFVFQNMGGQAGENTLKRLWGDLQPWNDAIQELTQLDHLLDEVSHSGDFKKIIALHEKIHSLESFAGYEATKEANYYVAQMVARFFQEHYANRFPVPFNFIARMFSSADGKSISLSKIHGGKNAMSLTNDGINRYFQELADTGMIDRGTSGEWNFDKLSRSVGVDFAKIVPTEIVPSIGWAMVIFIMYQALSVGLKEFDGKKK